MQNFLKSNPKKIFLLVILLAATLRIYGLNFDQGHHLHPDERAITMVVGNIRLPQTGKEWQEILTSQSTLNPHFFPYGSFPLYLLKMAGFLASFLHHSFNTYDNINLVGRFLSALFDIGTVILVYFIAKKLFNQVVGLLASFLYTVSVLPIQNAHFYTVDIPLTFFITLTLYKLLDFYQNPDKKKALWIGIFFGLGLATKFSAFLLIVPIGITVIIINWRQFFTKEHRIRIFSTKFFLASKKVIFEGGLIVFCTLATFLIFEPFATIDFSTFKRHILEQYQMTRSAFTFPYTLQYVGKPPYLYEIKQIFLWGLGPLLAIFAFAGVLYTTYLGIKKPVDRKGRIVLLFSYFWIYFFVVGKFAIGYIRYMLPIYPLLALSAAVLINHSFAFLKSKFKIPITLLLIFYSVVLILILIWPVSFISIYSKTHSRITASQWILNNIPKGSILAQETWDDNLPLGETHLYNIEELPMNEPDNSSIKWAKINQVLERADYIIISSNRNYRSLQKLIDCEKLPIGRCYKRTAEFYRQLFENKLNFIKVAEFAVFPKIPFLNFEIDDSSSDEIFTVYDHPKVMIFRNEKFN